MDIEQMNLDTLRDQLYKKTYEDKLYRDRYRELLKENLILRSGGGLSGGIMNDSDMISKYEDYLDYGGYGTKKGAKKGLATKKAKGLNLKEIAKKGAKTRKKNRDAINKLSLDELIELRKAEKELKKNKGKNEKSKRKKLAFESPWISYVKKYAKENGITYGEALKKASRPYRMLNKEK
jgi:hypothetical protein